MIKSIDKETMEILADKELLRSIDSGLKDIKAGRVVNWKIFHFSENPSIGHWTC